MSISVTYTVFCDSCHWWAEEQSAESKKEALEFAKHEGYRRAKVPNGSYWDFCPKCFNKR